MTDEADVSQQAACSLTVFHDGSCALCQREIALAHRLTDGANIAFVDVSATPGTVVAPGLTANAAMRRFHVRRADGTLVSGARAFIELWSQSPRLAWLRKLGDWPSVIRALDVLYSGLLVIRPPLSRLVRRIDTRRAQRSSRNT